MICSLSDNQKAAVENLTRVLIKRNPADSPATILRKLYDIGYQQLSDTGKGEEYGVAFVQHSALTLDKVFADTESGERDIAKSLFGNDKFSSSEINKYIHENEIRKLVGLRDDIKVNRNTTIFSEAEQAKINALLDKIKSTFPKITGEKQFTKPMRFGKPLDPIDLRVMEGNVPLFRVSIFAKNDTPRSSVPRQQNGYLIPEGDQFAESFAYGNMADYAMRVIFRNKGKSFPDIKNQLATDPYLINAFSAYSKEGVTPENNPLSSENFKNYFDIFLNDLVYVASHIESEYQGYYITDLSELVDRLSPEDKSVFNIYSKQLGLIGELDLLAIHPDGTFRVIDIKTSNRKIGTRDLDIYNKQVSAYTHILSEVTGLRPEGKADIFSIEKDYRLILQSVYDKGVTRADRRKVVLKDVTRYEQALLSKAEIAEAAAKYRESILRNYTIVDTPIEITTPENFNVRPGALSPDSILAKMLERRRAKESGKGLKMTYLSNEPQSTPESVKAGARELERIFPELKGRGIRIIPHFLSSTGGNFMTDMITLAEKSNEGVAYHEGWHRFSQLFLTKEEKTTLYENVRKEAIPYTTREGKKTNTKNADFKELEEFLAEEFRKYALNPRAYKSTPKSIFKQMWDFLKALLGFANRNGDLAYQELFERLYKGTYYRGNYSTANVMWDNLNSFYKNNRNKGESVLDDLTFLKYRDFSDGLLSSYLRSQSQTITDLLSKKGITIVNDTIRESLEVYRESIQEMVDAGKDSEVLFQEWENLNKILGNEDYPDTFNDFLRSYYRTTNFDSLRLFIKSNSKRVYDMLDEDARSAEEVDEDEGQDGTGTRKKPATENTEEHKEQEMEWDRNGNEKSALQVAREALKDFFIGIPELSINGPLLGGQQTSDFEIIGENGLPVYLNKSKAFNKTLEILEGHFTWEEITKQLNNTDNYHRFPELQVIRDRLLGNSEAGIQGLLPRLWEIEEEIEHSTNTGEKQSKVEEHSKMLGFLKHFSFVMTMPNVRYETFVINEDVPYENSFEAYEDSKKVDPVYTRKNSETVINSIINDFTRGFQTSAREEQERRVNNGEAPFMSVFDAFFIAMAQGEVGQTAAWNRLSTEKYFYDSELKVFHFNPYYASKQFPKALFADSVPLAVVKDFFETFGIHLNEKAYEKSEPEIREVYSRLTSVNDKYFYHAADIMRNMSARTSRGETLSKKELSAQLQILESNIAKETAKDPEDWDKKKLAEMEFQRTDFKSKIRGAARLGFPINPVEELLYVGQDREVRKKDFYKTFAITLPTFIDLANIEKQYKDNFSSGSMIVLEGTQYSYFLPNQLLMLSKMLKNNIQSFEDFDKSPETRHLNPLVNPQYLNSWMIRNLFDKTGRKREGMAIDIAVISQIAHNKEDGTKVEKKISELSKGEKLGIDFLMGTREGTTEMRRMEASNTAYRMSLVNQKEGGYEYIKPVTIGNSQFRDEDFLNQMRNYIQAAAWKYIYDSDVEGTPNPPLGIFESMLPEPVVASIKNFINTRPKGYDYNSLMKDMEKEANGTFIEVSNAIADYFEDITFRNTDSFAVDFERLIPESQKTLMLSLATTFRGKTVNGNVIHSSSGSIGSFSQLMRDEQFRRQIREYIANDFIMAMEDSLLFFGDYTLYKDPSKRRKVLSNNGSTAMSDKMIANSERIQNEHSSLSSVYRQARGMSQETGKDYQLIRKATLKDKKFQSVYTKGGENSRLVADLQDLYKQVFHKNLTKKEVYDKKKVTIDAFDNMEMADAAAYISLDTFKRMRETEQTWLEKDTKEYNRQKLILKDKLHKKYGSAALTDDEVQFVESGPYSGFNVAKYATTGPVYSAEHTPLKSTFDKMGLKVMLPESDWDNKQHLFEEMLSKNIDYMVYDSGSKIYKSEAFDVWDSKANPKKPEISYVEHAGGFFKYQQNTSGIKDTSTFASQLRGTFFEIMELHRNADGTHNPELKEIYDNFLKSLRDYMSISSVRGLSKIGLDKDGKFMKDAEGNNVGKKIFVDKIRQSLIEVGDVDLSVLEALNIEGDDFVTLLEALPLHKEIFNVVSGIIDDHFRKIKLNGSKLYQTPEIGTKIKKDKGTGTISLKWHGLIRDVKGNITGVSPCECKISFKKNFKPLLMLEHSDGQRIGIGTKSEQLKRLNSMLRNDAWVEEHKESLTFIGVRIPLQDLNFTSHMIVKEFLPESEADSIIVPPEFYKQTGGDNDIDTITATFTYLNKRTGHPIRKVKESYDEINKTIEELTSQLKDEGEVISWQERTDEINDRVNQMFEQMVEEGMGTEDELNEALSVKRIGGVLMFQGSTKDGLLAQFHKDGVHDDILIELQDIIDDLNEVMATVPKDDAAKKLKEAVRKRNDYMKGLTNSIASNITTFLSRPESFEYVTETDSMIKIENISKKLLSISSGQLISSIALNGTPSSIEAISQKNNLINHENNFQIRTILGSYVKFRRLLTTLSLIDTSLSEKYSAHSADTLYQMASNPKAAKKVYERTMWTPLLREAVIGGRIPIKMYDENGDRISKNMSMLVSTLLDLFKNIDTYPSLNITWNNVKPLIMLVTQGVPLETAITFLNNPVVRMVEENRQAMGTEFQLRHAIVKTSQDLFGTDIHPQSGMEGWTVDGSTPNNSMRRHGKFGEEYLKEFRNYSTSSFKITPEMTEQFMKDFAKYRRDNNTFQPKDLKDFLATPEGEQYKKFAEDIMAYYSTLVEDGDLFYQMVIKKMDRDATKYNSISQIADTEKTSQALVNSKMLNKDFLPKLQESSVFSPFYNDRTVVQTLKSLMPALYREDLPEWNNSITSMIVRLSSKIYGSSEDKRRVESIIVADLVEFLYKNFFYIKVRRKDPTDPTKSYLVYQLPYEFFERDINPEMSDKQLRSYIYRNQSSTNEVHLTDNNSTYLRAKGVGDNEDLLSGYALFTNQIELFRAKYPELLDLKIIQKLLPKRMQAYFKPPEVTYETEENEDGMGTDMDDYTFKKEKEVKQPPITVSQIFNMFSQAYLSMNLPTSPQEKMNDEQQIRDEWRKLVKFNLSDFPAIWSKLTKDKKRMDFYKDKNNMKEIQSFFKMMSYYAMVQSSHLNKMKGSFAYLAPQSTLTQVITKTFDNFFGAITDKKGKSLLTKPEYERLLGDFERMFVEMNTDLGYEVPDKGDGYRKTQSGKLYSKFSLANPTVKSIQSAIVARIKAEGVEIDELGNEVLPRLGNNNFIIDVEEVQDDPFLDETC